MSDETAPRAPSLGGNLADFPLPDVLTFLNMGQKSGVIEASAPSGARNDIYLVDGEVVGATSTIARFQLPQFLASRGLITEPTAETLVRRAKRELRTFRELVVEGRFVDASEMVELEKLLYFEIAFEAMRWRQGRFAFAADGRPTEDMAQLRIGVQNLILEGVRRMDEASRFESEVAVDRNRLLTLVCATGRLEQDVVLTPVEWGVISLINGKRTIDDIFSLRPTDSEADTWAILQRLQAAHMIQIDPVAMDEETIVHDDLLVEVPKRTMGIPIYRNSSPEPPPPPPVLPPQPPPEAEKTDVHLVSGTGVTTSHGMFGRRLPARLVAKHDPTIAFELVRPVLTIGRGLSNDIVLAHPSVSKQHAQLMQEEEGWRLVDLRSTNGTLVNSTKITERRLEPRDVVDIGAFTLLFDAVAPAKSVETT
jgi:hypothetical protein